MQEQKTILSLNDWIATYDIRCLEPIEKTTSETRAWFASSASEDLFLKLFPYELDDGRFEIESAIAGSNLHPAIVPLLRKAQLREGTLLVYPRILGENLGVAAREMFQRLSLAKRSAAVLTVCDALSAIGEAGYMLVDWYEGNMIYDFPSDRIWLFDWDLCRRGSGFILEMDSNYGSSRIMAPEEFVKGSWLDSRTIVFNLGRYVLLTLPELAEDLADVLARATYPTRAQRYESARAFTDVLRDRIRP